MVSKKLRPKDDILREIFELESTTAFLKEFEPKPKDLVVPVTKQAKDGTKERGGSSDKSK